MLSFLSRKEGRVWQTHRQTYWRTQSSFIIYVYMYSTTRRTIILSRQADNLVWTVPARNMGHPTISICYKPAKTSRNVPVGRRPAWGQHRHGQHAGQRTKTSSGSDQPRPRYQRLIINKHRDSIFTSSTQVNALKQAWNQFSHGRYAAVQHTKQALRQHKLAPSTQVNSLTKQRVSMCSRPALEVNTLKQAGQNRHCQCEGQRHKG